MKKRLFALLLAITLLLSLVACGQGETATDAPSDKVKEPTSTIQPAGEDERPVQPEKIAEDVADVKEKVKQPAEAIKT